MLLYQMSDVSLNLTILPLSSRFQLVCQHRFSHIGQKTRCSTRIRTEEYYQRLKRKQPNSGAKICQFKLREI